MAIFVLGSDGAQGFLEVAFNGMIAVAQLIAQSSYIGTNIIMMVSNHLKLMDILHIYIKIH